MSPVSANLQLSQQQQQQRSNQQSIRTQQESQQNRDANMNNSNNNNHSLQKVQKETTTEPIGASLEVTPPTVTVARKRGRRRQQSIPDQPNGLDRVFIWDIDGSLVRGDTLADSQDSLAPSVLTTVADKLGILAKKLKELTINYCDQNFFLGELETSDQMHIDDVHSDDSSKKFDDSIQNISNNTNHQTTTEQSASELRNDQHQRGSSDSYQFVGTHEQSNYQQFQHQNHLHQTNNNHQPGHHHHHHLQHHDHHEQADNHHHHHHHHHQSRGQHLSFNSAAYPTIQSDPIDSYNLYAHHHMSDTFHQPGLSSIEGVYSNTMPESHWVEATNHHSSQGHLQMVGSSYPDVATNNQYVTALQQQTSDHQHHDHHFHEDIQLNHIAHQDGSLQQIPQFESHQIPPHHENQHLIHSLHTQQQHPQMQQLQSHQSQQQHSQLIQQTTPATVTTTTAATATATTTNQTHDQMLVDDINADESPIKLEEPIQADDNNNHQTILEQSASVLRNDQHQRAASDSYQFVGTHEQSNYQQFQHQNHLHQTNNNHQPGHHHHHHLQHHDHHEQADNHHHHHHHHHHQSRGQHLSFNSAAYPTIQSDPIDSYNLYAHHHMSDTFHQPGLSSIEGVYSNTMPESHWVEATNHHSSQGHLQMVGSSYPDVATNNQYVTALQQQTSDHQHHDHHFHEDIQLDQMAHQNRTLQPLSHLPIHQNQQQQQQHLIQHHNHDQNHLLHHHQHQQHHQHHLQQQQQHQQQIDLQPAQVQVNEVVQQQSQMHQLQHQQRSQHSQLIQQQHPQVAAHNITTATATATSTTTVTATATSTSTAAAKQQQQQQQKAQQQRPESNQLPTLRTVLNNHHKQMTHRLSVRFHKIKSVYNSNRSSCLNTSNGDTTTATATATATAAATATTPTAAAAPATTAAVATTTLTQQKREQQDQELHQQQQQTNIVAVAGNNLPEILAEIDHYTLDWRKRAMDCLRLISESQNCTNIIVTKLPLVIALGHLVCLGLSQFFEVDQVYSASKTNKESCIKRIKKRFGATNRCSYIIVGDKEDVEMAKRLDLPSWTTSRSDGHRQLLQLYTALKEGYLM